MLTVHYQFVNMSSLRFSSILRVALTAFLVTSILRAATPERLRCIFDTDMGNDIDDALALAMLHSFTSRQEADLIGVTLTKDNRWAAPYVDLVNTFYGRPQIPIGVVKAGKTPENSRYIQVPSQRRRSDGSLVYPHRLHDGKNAPDAVELLRTLLKNQPDGSVVIVQVGFSTNLARLLETDRDLIATKVKLLSTMAGNFQKEKPEYNVKVDIPAAKKLFAQWPSPIVVSGYEVGETILYPARSIERDFAYVPDHPVAEGYRLYQKMPYNRQTWDLTSVLYAVRPDRDYFSLSPTGTVQVDDKGSTVFKATPNGRHRYLIVNQEQRVRILEAMQELASQPPCSLPAQNK